MPMNDPIPTGIKRPATFFTIVHTPAAGALTPLELAIAIIGTKRATGAMAVETPVEIFDVADADREAGINSPLSVMARAALDERARKGVGPRIFLVGVAEPGAGTAHAKTATFTGPATADGNLEVDIMGRRIVVGVTNGDSANTIAAAFNAAVGAAVTAGEFPFTAAVVGAVVTHTMTTKGENGGDVQFTLVRAPTGVGVAFANGAVGSGVIDLTNAIDSLVDRMYDYIAVENHKAADIADIKAHTAVACSATSKLWRNVVVGERGSVSTANTLGTTANDKTVMVVACEDCPALCGEIAARAAAALASTSRPNYNFDGVTLGLPPPPAAKVFTAAELESLLASGVTPLVTTDAGTEVKIVRAITTKTTTGSAPDDTQSDIGYVRTGFYMARQYDIGFQVGFIDTPDEEAKLLSDTTVDRVRDMILGKQRAAAAANIIQDVEELKGQLVVTPANVPAYRLLVDAPHRVVSALHQVSARVTQYL